MTVDVTSEYIRDKINGGIIGQFFGNLNGLIHENKYTDEPGNVEEYIPDLSEGAFTDDDTDIEFVYIYHMLEENQYLLPYDRISELWKEHLNDGVYCSNSYARNLMNLDILPPTTGYIAFNPWAVFNISGQFLCEQFALISPGMPQTAAKIGTHYTHVAVDGEPIQTTQLFTAMISTAFFEDDFMKIINAGLKAVDPDSEIHEIVSNVISWYKLYPNDWRKTRLEIKENYWTGEYVGEGGSNGYRTITAATIAAILYGEGDFVEAVRYAFNFGWDADNISAMVGTIMGTIKGEKWLRSQGWKIKDEYRNTRRPGLPTDLTITQFAELHYQLAKKVILHNGGEEITINNQEGYRIALQEPKNIENLPRPLNRLNSIRTEWWPKITKDLNGNSVDRARAVYASICLDLVEQAYQNQPDKWLKALEEFKPYFEPLIEKELRTPEEKDHFRDIVFNKNAASISPYGYERFEMVKE